MNINKCSKHKQVYAEGGYCTVCKIESRIYDSDLTAAQAEIAELKELIKREVVPDIKDAEIARLQSALDVAVEGLENIKSNLDSFKHLEKRYKESGKDKVSFDKLAEVRAIDVSTSSALDKIKQIRGLK